MKTLRKKRCNICRRYRYKRHFSKDATTKDGYYGKCKPCVKAMTVVRLDRSFLYGEGDVMKNNEYLSDRRKLFGEHGNGWWSFSSTLLSTYKRQEK